MRKSLHRSLFWAPRVLALLFALFISLFALDVFGEGYGPWETILALLIHLLPTAMVLLALAIAWYWEGVGGILFIALGALYVALSWGQFDWMAYLLISGPLLLIGALFLAGRYRRARSDSGA